MSRSCGLLGKGGVSHEIAADWNDTFRPRAAPGRLARRSFLGAAVPNAEACNITIVSFAFTTSSDITVRSTGLEHGRQTAELHAAELPDGQLLAGFGVAQPLAGSTLLSNRPA